MLPACALAMFLLQAGDPLLPTPFDRVFDLELSADDEALIKGYGPTTSVEYPVEFSGTLHLWTRSELDLVLRVQAASDGTILAEDNDSGGGNVPFIYRSVEKGDQLTVLIASTTRDALGAFELHAIASPETETTRKASDFVGERLAEVRRLQQEGKLDATRPLIEEFVSKLLSCPGARHSDAISVASRELGFLARNVGDLASARAAWTLVCDQWARVLPVEHHDLLAANHNLGVLLHEQGDLANARARFEAVLAVGDRTLPPEDPMILAARGSLANVLTDTGDLAGARTLQESVLAVFERTLPAEHVLLSTARQNLANTIRQLGDLAGARALLESVVQTCERSLPPNHDVRLRALSNLAVTLMQQGELPRARALLETVVAGWEQTLPPDHPDLLRDRSNLAGVMSELGDLVGARQRQEAILLASEGRRACSRLGGLGADGGSELGSRIAAELAVGRFWPESSTASQAL